MSGQTAGLNIRPLIRHSALE